MINVNYPAGKAGQIQVVDGLLGDIPEKFIQRVQTHWHEASAGKTLGGVIPRTKLTQDLHYGQETGLQWSDEDRELEKTICLALTDAISIYRQEYEHLNEWVGIRDSGFQVQRYPKSQGYYRVHVDSFPIPYSSVSDRVLAAIIYLNDVDYGGETNFPLHGVKVKPEAGRICLFPAVFTHPHESCVPITQDKWIISTFILNTEGSQDAQLPNEEHIHDDHSHDDHSHEPPPLIMGEMPEPVVLEDFITDL